ncbi:pyridoxal phosphate-dependent decarboxylase family protein [Kribbella sp. NPDC004536]|uniref:pyridoxal phosphate-dependent decarboxylase family protein n=1 Tax=Kribbella sp. NPDC004536 TaxID=3364106 RepID=UPI003689E27D
MRVPDWKGPLGEAFLCALDYLEGLQDRPVGPRATPAALRSAFAGPLPEIPGDPCDVVRELAGAAEGGLLPSGSGRFFGFVFGGATPTALAADWLATAWDQNAALFATSPAAAAAEQVAAEWLVELFGLPETVSVGFVTGAQMASFTGLAAARNETLMRAGWDVERDGLIGAPPIRVLVGAERHDTIDRALRFLGLGTSCMTVVQSDDRGRMRADALAEALAAGEGPTIVCAQVGNVNTGSIDPVGEICDLAHAAGAWVHVDGAFGLWAASSPELRHLVSGIERADSWASDAHKWLNVPYDSGLVFCAHPRAHNAAMAIRASYLIHDANGERDSLDHNPEFSRRARGFAIYAAIRALGRRGIAEIVEECCALAGVFADELAAATGAVVLAHDLNQVLVSFRSPTGDHDALTRDVVTRVQAEGTCWMSGTNWRGQDAMRISVSSWATDAGDVRRAIEAILRCADAARLAIRADDKNDLISA